jgi:hypothetical protein
LVAKQGGWLCPDCAVLFPDSGEIVSAIVNEAERIHNETTLRHELRAWCREKLTAGNSAGTVQRALREIADEMREAIQHFGDN